MCSVLVARKFRKRTRPKLFELRVCEAAGKFAEPSADNLCGVFNPWVLLRKGYLEQRCGAGPCSNVACALRSLCAGLLELLFCETVGGLGVAY